MLFNMRNYWSLALLAIPSIAAQTVTYEAEDAVLTGVSVATSVTGFTGTGYVDGYDAATDKIDFSVASTDRKLYDVVIRYSAPYGTKSTSMKLNGSGGDVVLTETAAGVWATASAGQVLLEVGTNHITIENNWGYYFIDALLVTPSAPRAAHQVTADLVTPNATPATKSLMSFLVKNYGKAIISGQQDLAMLKWVEEKVGKTPAILGLDMIEYSPTRAEQGSTSTAVEEAIAWDQKGGIVNFVWHWNAPAGLYNVVGKEWWRGFYTGMSDFDFVSALETTNANHTLLLRDIDAIAVQLKRLQAANVPVVWRPLHEADGGWFWWGASGAEPCKRLWALVFDRLNNYHKLDNLIWVWNSVNAAWYPGDDTVDILSYDSYPTAGDHGPVSAQYNALLALGKDKKLIAATEVGTIPDPDLLQAYQADWSYFVTWANEFIQDAKYNSLEFLERIYNLEYVLTLDEITGWKGPATATTTTAGVTTSAFATTTTTSAQTTTTLITVTATTTATTTASTCPAAQTTTVTAAVTVTAPASTVTVTATVTAEPITSTSTSTTAPPVSTTATVCQSKYGQCGGVNYSGPKCCNSGATCTKSNDYYSQCL